MEIKLKSSKAALSQNQVVFIVVVALLVVLNAAVLFLFLLPGLDSLKVDKQGIDQKNVTLQSVKNEYTNENISDEQMTQITTRVPVKRIDSENFVFINDLSVESNTPLAYVRQSGGTESEPQSTAGSQNSGTMITGYEVLVVGHLPDLLAYIDNMQKHERLFSLQKWSITEQTKEAINKDYPELFSFSFINKDKAIYALQMTVQAYVFPQLANAFLTDSIAE
ncbi:hypothetical protein BK133_28410 [Paenibacillus sp. FSL H8-0548]|uniref:hypothetical protein n=1 Tax=Paenibacillus sp. FSL H8-0548 TaxID=1920422 RepID=UPI00096E1FCB|nr:hypothetical protein [Paenibacillus sp. FSL H8-0548]OMF21440.1 hypothetical protein BK133_28410 [Paenibacillus sp. FSL H8-0548]